MYASTDRQSDWGKLKWLDSLRPRRICMSIMKEPEFYIILDGAEFGWPVD